MPQDTFQVHALSETSADTRATPPLLRVQRPINRDRLAGECAIKTTLNVRYTGVIQIHDGLCND